MSFRFDKMPLAVAALVGAVCQPLTFQMVVHGSIPMAITVIAVLGAAAGMLGMGLSGDKRPRQIGLLLAAFVTGDFVSGLVSFGHYYWTYGYDDPKLSVGIGISILYFATVAGVGGLALLIAALLQRSKESRATLSSPL